MPRMIPEDLTTLLYDTLLVYKAMTEASDGITPTARALGEKLGIGHSAAHQRIQALRAAGYLTMPPITQTRLRLSAKGKKVAT